MSAPDWISPAARLDAIEHAWLAEWQFTCPHEAALELREERTGHVECATCGAPIVRRS